MIDPMTLSTVNILYACWSSVSGIHAEILVVSTYLGAIHEAKLLLKSMLVHFVIEQLLASREEKIVVVGGIRQGLVDGVR